MPMLFTIFIQGLAILLFSFINKDNFSCQERAIIVLNDQQNNTWLLADMKFLFSRATRHLTRSQRSLVSYRVKYSKRNSISTHAHVLFSVSVKVHFASLVPVFL